MRIDHRDYPGWLGQDLDPGLSGPKLTYFSAIGLSRFILVPNKISEWFLSNVNRCPSSYESAEERHTCVRWEGGNRRVSDDQEKPEGRNDV